VSFRKRGFSASGCPAMDDMDMVDAWTMDKRTGEIHFVQYPCCPHGPPAKRPSACTLPMIRSGAKAKMVVSGCVKAKNSSTFHQPAQPLTLELQVPAARTSAACLALLALLPAVLEAELPREAVFYRFLAELVAKIECLAG
jgi:hypothetical protein